LHKNAGNGKSKKVKTPRVFDKDFKTEIVRMRSAAQFNLGKNVPELSKSFDITESSFARRSVSFKNNQNMKKHTNTSKQ
jgi:transposase-like protein